MPSPLGILWAEPTQIPKIPPRFANKPKAPHVTLAWGVTKGKHIGHIGLTTLITFKAECWDSQNQAVLCTLEDDTPFELVIPHCTISWASCTSAKASTEMLRKSHQSRPIEKIIPCVIKWVPLEDSAGAYRLKVLTLMRQGVSCNESCKRLGLKSSTLRSWFKRLAEDHPQRLEYEGLARKNMGGWKPGRSRKNN